MTTARVAELADLLSSTPPPRVRTGQVTEVNGTTGRLRVDITGTAWLPRNLDGTFAVNDVVLVLSSGPLSMVVARIG